jgi:hypothetical protein
MSAVGLRYVDIVVRAPMVQLIGEPSGILRLVDVVEHVGCVHALALRLCPAPDEVHPVLPPGRMFMRFVVHAIEHVVVTQGDRKQSIDELVLKAPHQIVLLLPRSGGLLVFRMPRHPLAERVAAVRAVRRRQPRRVRRIVRVVVRVPRADGPGAPTAVDPVESVPELDLDHDIAISGLGDERFQTRPERPGHFVEIVLRAGAGAEVEPLDSGRHARIEHTPEQVSARGMQLLQGFRHLLDGADALVILVVVGVVIDERVVAVVPAAQ